MKNPKIKKRNHRLTTAIRISKSATAILQRVECFNRDDIHDYETWDLGAHITIDPMLLALSMELILKAWYIFDYNEPKAKPWHDLLELFEQLKPESQQKLESKFQENVIPLHPNFVSVEYGIKTLLGHHSKAFEEWRYAYEADTLRFDQSTMTETLKMVIDEFNKLYRTEIVPTPWLKNWSKQ